MPTTAPGLTAPPDCHLQKAVEDSHYLLAYFSRTRVDIPVDKRKAFSDAVTTLSSFRVTGSRVTKSQTISAKSASGNPGGNTSAGTDEIAKFWNAFIFLSDLAYPATIESIRYYFSFHYDSVKRIEGAERGNRKRRYPGGGFIFNKAQSSFVVLTFLALFMAIGLSLLSYIGSTALADYDADYAHWSQVQILVRYLDEGGKPKFTGDQTADGRHLVLKFSNASALGQISPNTPIARNASLSDNSATIDPIPDMSLEVPAARIPRISKLLIDADLADNPPTSFEFACSHLLDLFATARGSKLTDPPPGALRLEECLTLMAKVRPHVLSVADDLALTFSSMEAERKTLSQILGLVSFPVRMFDAAVASPSWVYHMFRQLGASGVPTAQAAQTEPTTRPSPASENSPPQGRNLVLAPADAFDIFVLEQQRHAPIPTIIPIPSVKTLGGIFDARLAVAISNTYLLTIAFGFLGACVWVLREINARLEDFTLAPSQFWRYRARILLGMVAGPTIGLFFQGGHLVSFATSSTDVRSLSTQLSATAIAFVAGFSIEIVFAILDRFIRIIQEFAGVNSPHQAMSK
jgi:hypothetical protein